MALPWATGASPEEFSPLGVLMADASAIPVFGFCELMAAMLGSPAGDALYRGDPFSVRMGVFMALALLSAVVGPMWPRLKGNLPRRFSATFVHTASDFRWWLIVLFFGFIVPPLTGLFLSSRPRPGQIVGYVNDIDTGAVVAGPLQALASPSSSSTPTETDARLLPFAAGSTFFSGLPVNTEQSCKVLCFPFEPMSCNIAARYRDRLADHWTPDGPIVFDYSNPANFKGISIIAQSEKRPSGALLLRSQFRSLGVEPLFPIADPSVLKLGPNEFAVWIGSEP